ncbi:MAG: hydantoinase/oxoprolinase family protein, partial [Thermoplasmata archaeon]|nr:hydantoinase/oxoprolinase family protein [Thermoplasmata archaeon]
RCFGLRERVDARGRVLVRPTRREINRVVRAVRESGAESVAISFLFAFLRPEHERALATALEDLAVSASHQVLAEFREYERSSTTVLDAYVKPLVTRYLAGLEAALGHTFQVMKSSGGVEDQRTIRRRPVEMVLSGPAGGVAAAASLSRLSDTRDLVTFDMGGTSADFSVLSGGQPTWRTDAIVDTFPIAIPVVDIESVGAGGGSFAWRDAGGALRVGPQSAGAVPGPIAYGQGGTRVTVTDCDLVGGVLRPSLLGGRLPLDLGLATRGVERLATEFRLDVQTAVLGVQNVVRASMAKAMRIVLARRGLDPREHALVAFGGAGPMHAWALARELGTRQVIVPFLPGAFSAYGILISPVRVGYSRSVVRPLGRSAALIKETLTEFRERAIERLREQSLDPRRAVIQPSVDLRYRGQSYEINIPAKGHLAAGFRRQHRLRYGYATREDEIELVTIRLVARVPRVVRRPRPSAAGRERPEVEHRRVLFEDGWSETRVYRRESLRVGSEIDGPAIVEEDHATTVIPPDGRLSVDRAGLLRIEVRR